MQRRVAIFFLTCSFCCSSFAQVKDAGLWTSFSIEKKISQAASLAINEEFRFNENVSEVGTFFTDIGVTYKLNNDLRVSGSYRFINKKRLDDSFSKRHRYYFDLSYKRKINKTTSAIRVRFQSQYADVFSSDDGAVPEWYLRPKISLRCNMKGKCTPYVSSELFYHFAVQEFDNVRYTFGMERKLSGKLDLDLFFLHQRAFNVENPAYDYIWGIGLNYSL